MYFIRKYLFYFLLLLFSVETQAQTCIDTSFKIIYESPYANLTNSVHLVDKNNNSFYIGKMKSAIDTFDYIFKTNSNNQVLWAKKSVFGDNNFNSAVNAISVDSNALIILYRANTDSIIKFVKIDSLGNTIWLKEITTESTIYARTLNIQIIDSSIYLTFHLLTFSDEDGQYFHNSIVKLDYNGNIIWKKYYGKTYQCQAAYPFGIIKNNDSLIVWGRMATNSCIYPSGGNTNREISYYAMKISSLNGELGSSIAYLSPKEFSGQGSIGLNNIWTFNYFSINKANNNFIFTNIFSPFLSSIKGACRVEFDSNLDIINSIFYSNNNDLGTPRFLTNSQGFTSVFSNGNNLQFPRTQYIALFDKYNNAIRQKKTTLPPTIQSMSYNFKTFESKFNYLNLASNFVENNVGKIQLSQINIDEQNSTCFGEDTSFVTASAFDITPFSSPFFDGAFNLAVQINNVPLPPITNLAIIKTDFCQTISTCNTLTVTPKIDTVCKLNNTYTYTAHLNGACLKHVNWIIDTSAVSFINTINDSAVQIKFKKTWQGYLYAFVNSCSTLKDSVKIAAYNTPDTINLSLNGANFCTSNTVTLKAGAGFKTYLWQNGSTDSTFLATVGGMYYVTAFDYCGNKFTDTILLNKYISRLPVNLGNDTVICPNTNILLQAGLGYKSYTWSTGSNAASINVSQAGNYYVTVKDSCGNISSDSITVKIYTIPPVVNIGTDVEYCEGKSFTFNAGSIYKYYTWQDGSTGQTFIANAIGKYYVTVKDSCGYISSDTVQIRKALISSLKIDYPFLLCREDTAFISLPLSLINYTWSPSVLTNKMGNSLMLFPNQSTLYNFTGETYSGCVLKDTMFLKVINCPTDIYFPTAFTPNRDNINDTWKPITFRKLSLFEMNIYNRYGQVIFSSKNINNGWAGVYLGEAQNAGTFVYSVKYKIGNKAEQLVKGTILLIR